MAAECVPNVVSVVTGLGGILAGGVIGYFSARLVASLTARRTACVKLHGAFSLALGQIAAARHYRSDDPGRPNVSGFLREAFVAHAAAVGEFRFFVSKTNQGAYEKAWQHYCELDTARGNAEFMVSDQPKPLSVIEAKINAILVFADP